MEHLHNHHHSHDPQERRESNVSEADLLDTEHCILCFNDLRFFGLGKCNHKNVCHTCILRLRLIMKDIQCPICKTQLDEVLITENQDITFSQFKLELQENLLNDKEDQNVYYENGRAKAAGLKLRALQCLIINCNPGYQFHTLEELKRHLEIDHQKTFCKICLKGRLVFIREQKLYNIKYLKNHIQFGDVGSDRQAEILPHPWCDFCEEYYFNDMIFSDHLNRNHLTCHLCGDQYKNIFYKEYANLENHFAWSHFLCPYENCKAKCYVSFRTEDELQAHVDIEHRSKEKAIKANALLGFDYDQQQKKKVHHKVEIKDSEGVDFSFYFSEKYNFVHDKKKKEQQYAQEHQDNYQNQNYRGRGGRGRGRGDRGGRGGRGNDGGYQGPHYLDDRYQQRNDQNKEDKTNDKSQEQSLRNQKTPKGKLSLALSFISKYITDKMQKEPETEQQEYTAPKSLLYQMYFVIAKLDENKLARLDFLVNFGVSLEVIHLMLDLIENGGEYDSAIRTFNQIPFSTLLKVNKYLSWADKKLHSVFYIENKDSISEDLLNDFKDPDNEAKFVKPQGLSKGASLKDNKAENVIIKSESLLSEHDYLFGKKKDTSKIIDVKSNQDFPTLGLGGGPVLDLGAQEQLQKGRGQTSQALGRKQVSENVKWGGQILEEKRPVATPIQQSYGYSGKTEKQKKQLEQSNFPGLPGMQVAPKKIEPVQTVFEQKKVEEKKVEVKKIEEKKEEKKPLPQEEKKPEPKQEEWRALGEEEQKQEVSTAGGKKAGGGRKKKGGAGKAVELKSGFY